MSDLDRETLLDEIRRLLPEPVREEVQLDGNVVLAGGNPGEVIVRVSGSRVSIAVYTVRWEGSHTPVVRPKQLGSLDWNHLPASATMITLDGLVSAAIELRRAKYLTCEKCGERHPPEWMHDGGVCQSCAERHLGMVY